MGVSYFKKEGQNEYRWNFSTTPKRRNLINLYKRLVLTKGRDGGVVKENDSPRSRSAEDAPSEYTRFPIELLATQYHESEGVKQVRPLQRPVDDRRKVQHGGRSSYSNFRSHTTYVRDTLQNTYTRTLSMLTHHAHRIRSSGDVTCISSLLSYIFCHALNRG
jgi:hypothetical protein